MILDFGDYKIVTDERQFIVQAKKVIQEGRFTNPENVGKEYYEDIRYFNSLNSTLKFLAKRTVLVNNDLKVIQEKLAELQRKIDEFSKQLDIDINM